MHPSNDLTTFCIAFASNRAGVDDAQIGWLFVFGIVVTNAQQAFANELRFVLVDFAAERIGFQERTWHFAIVSVCRWVQSHKVVGLVFRLDAATHRPLALDDAIVSAIGVDLILLQLSMLSCGRETYRRTHRINLLGELLSLLKRMPKELSQHSNYVSKRMPVIVPQANVKSRLTLPSMVRFALSFLDGDFYIGR